MATFGHANAIAGYTGSDYETAGYSGLSIFANEAYGVTFTTPANCAGIDTLEAMIYAPSGDHNCRASVWTSTGATIANGISSEVLIQNAGGYKSFAFTGLTLSPSTAYFFGIMGSGFVSGYTKAGFTGSTQRYDGTHTYGATQQTLDNDGENANTQASWYMTYTPSASVSRTQEGYRWRLDDGSETTATWAAAQDTGITAPANATRRLRVLIDTAGDTDATQFQLEYKEANDAGYTKVG